MIQIFTRHGDGQGAKPFFSAGYGTHQTLEGSAGSPVAVPATAGTASW